MSRERIGSLRLIPASAGSTACSLEKWGDMWAHPRVCGEHLILTVIPARGLGSSPRLRGARLTSALYRRIGRLIPASAGSTLADKHFQ